MNEIKKMNSYYIFILKNFSQKINSAFSIIWKVKMTIKTKQKLFNNFFKTPWL